MKSLDNVPSGLASRPVFLGGAYGKDRFLTAFGEQYGVMVHAATYYTKSHRVQNGAKFVAYLFDILVGFFAGYLFHWSWCRYRIAAALLREYSEEARPWLGAYLRARAVLILNFLLLAIMVYIIVSLAGRAYRWNYWIDPGPVILGVFIKTLIGSYVQPHPKKEHNQEGSTKMHCDEHHAILPAQRVDRIFWVPIVIWALYSLLHDLLINPT